MSQNVSSPRASANKGNPNEREDDALLPDDVETGTDVGGDDRAEKDATVDIVAGNAGKSMPRSGSTPTTARPGAFRVTGIASRTHSAADEETSSRNDEWEVAALDDGHRSTTEQSNQSEQVTVEAVVVSHEEVHEEVRRRILAEEVVEATVLHRVEEEDQASDDKASGHKRSWRITLFLLILVLVTIIIVVVPVSVLKRSRDSTSSEKSPPPLLLNETEIWKFVMRETPYRYEYDGSPDSSFPYLEKVLREILENDANPQLDARLLDKVALLTFYYANSPDTWLRSTGWATDTGVCRWYGVICNDRGLVTGLRLVGNGINGNIFIPLSYLSQRLTFVDLSQNSLFGGVQSILRYCQQLQYFNLSNNALSYAGTGNHKFIKFLGELTALQVLDLSDNAFSGNLYPNIGNLTQVETFLVHQNNLEGAIPEEIAQWKSIRTVRLDGNNFEGSVPSALCTRTSSTANFTMRVDCDKVSCDCCGCDR